MCDKFAKKKKKKKMTERLINYKKLFSFKHLMAVALFVNHRRFYSTSEYAV